MWGTGLWRPPLIERLAYAARLSADLTHARTMPVPLNRTDAMT